MLKDRRTIALMRSGGKELPLKSTPDDISDLPTLTEWRGRVPDDFFSMSRFFKLQVMQTPDKEILLIQLIDVEEVEEI